MRRGKRRKGGHMDLHISRRSLRSLNNCSREFVWSVTYTALGFFLYDTLQEAAELTQPALSTSGNEEMGVLTCRLLSFALDDKV